jgi:hypothetical protein
VNVGRAPPVIRAPDGSRPESAETKRSSYSSYAIVKGRPSTAKRLILIGSGQLEHANDGEAVLQPLLNLCTIRIHHRGPMAGCRVPINGFLQYPGHGNAADAQFASDRTLTLATLGQKVLPRVGAQLRGPAEDAPFHLP